jgi:hypothetical protein
MVSKRSTKVNIGQATVLASEANQHDGEYQQTTHDSEGISLAVLWVAIGSIMNIKERWVCCEGVKECGGKKKWMGVDKSGRLWTLKNLSNLIELRLWLDPNILWPDVLPHK